MYKNLIVSFSLFSFLFFVFDLDRIRARVKKKELFGGRSNLAKETLACLYHLIDRHGFVRGQ